MHIVYKISREVEHLPPTDHVYAECLLNTIQTIVCMNNINGVLLFNSHLQYPSSSITVHRASRSIYFSFILNWFDYRTVVEPRKPSYANERKTAAKYNHGNRGRGSTERSGLKIV